MKKKVDKTPLSGVIRTFRFISMLIMVMCCTNNLSAQQKNEEQHLIWKKR